MPSIELRGDGVLLRTTVAGDRSRLVAIRGTDAVRRRWRGDDLDAEFTDNLLDDEVCQLTIEAPDGTVIGMIQFSEVDDPEYRSAALDIYIDPAFHRRGHATDAVRTLADHLFDERHHHRLTIDPVVDNAAAIACYSKAGFRPVGVMRTHERQPDGGWADALLMDMLDTDRHRDADRRR